MGSKRLVQITSCKANANDSEGALSVAWHNMGKSHTYCTNENGAENQQNKLECCVAYELSFLSRTSDLLSSILQECLRRLDINKNCDKPSQQTWRYRVLKSTLGVPAVLCTPCPPLVWG